MTEHTRAAALAAGILLTTGALADPAPAGKHFASDPAKSSLEFSFVQAGAQNKGKFSKFPVTLDAAADGSAVTRLEVTVEMGSMDTGDKERDDTLRGPDLFSVAKFPQAHFVATQITKTAAGFDAAESRTTCPIYVTHGQRAGTRGGLSGRQDHGAPARFRRRSGGLEIHRVGRQ
jgi:polyisoprenoid-binding protein YceI